MVSHEEVLTFLKSLEVEELEIWRVLIVHLKEAKIKESEGDLVVVSSTSLRVSPICSPKKSLDISQWKSMPSPRRGEVRVKSLPAFLEQQMTTTESLDFNDVGLDYCSGAFANCHLGTVWFLRISGLYRPDELYHRTEAERVLVTQSSVCVEVIQRNEGTVVLRVLDMPARVQLTSTRTLYCLKKTLYDVSVVQEHFSVNRIKALRTSLRLADFDRYQMLLSVIRESSCYVSEIKWIRMQRNCKKSNDSETLKSTEDEVGEGIILRQETSFDSVDSTDISAVMRSSTRCSGFRCKPKYK